jgi:hypothetical protein
MMPYKNHWLTFGYVILPFSFTSVVYGDCNGMIILTNKLEWVVKEVVVNY